MTQVWQIAAGEPTRDYTDLFLKHDVMFMGPGRFGNYDVNAYELLKKKSLLSKGFAAQMRQFCTEVEAGDIILLRFGSKAKAIGIVHQSGYFWTDTFDDVYGWDLQHAHRVMWQHHLADELSRIQKEKDIFYYRGGSFNKVHKRVRERIKQLFPQFKSRALKSLPPSLPEPLTMEQLGEGLFSRGLPNKSVESVLLAIGRQRRLAKWYEEHGEKSKRPKEHEVVAHMILPFLLALGWSEQLLAVEWHKIDLAAFSGTPTTKENCCLVCEAKPLRHGLQNTFAQATGYVEKLKLSRCKKVLLTDGIRLYLYQRLANNEWNEVPFGYLNVKLIRTNHIAPANTNAVDTIMALTPAGIDRDIRKQL